MSFNKIRRLDSNAFRGMRFLRRLYLSDNVITDVGRRNFGALSKIGSIDLARNFLKKINHQMFFQLKFIDMMSDQVAKRAGMEGGNVDEVQRESTPPEKDVCDLGTQKFSEIVNVEAFVDKTLFIKEFLEASHDVIATFAPRRFGKSTLMDMVVEFLSGNKKLFQDNNLKIWKEERFFFDKYCQENPVIYVDFKSIGGTTVDDILEHLKKVISKAFKAHRYLIKVVEGKYSWSGPKLEEVMKIEKFQQYCEEPNTLTESDVTDGLKELSHLLHVYHGKPVYVFIDEYDNPIMRLIVYLKLGEEDLNTIIMIFGGLMSNLFKNNDHLKKGLIMACVRVAEVLSGDANNIEYYGFLKWPTFSRYFGFTAEEVDSLLNKDAFKHFKNDEVKEWYNGYRLTNSKEDPLVIYSSFSILNYLTRSKEMNEPCFERYWVDSGSIVYLEELFAENRVRELIRRLINKEEVEIKTITKFAKKHILTLQGLVHQKPKDVDTAKTNLFVQFLAENGYLNVVSYDVKKSTSIIRSPNMEINMLLREKCYNAGLLINKYKLSSENTENYLNALKSLLEKRDKEAFIMFAKALSQLFDGAVMPQNEDELHCILFTLAYDARKEYVVRSELGVQQQKPRGKSPSLDMLVILELVGMIIEFKFKYGSSKAAHDKIIEKGYATALNNCKDVEVKILMGLHMTSEKKISLTYSIDGSPEETVTSEMTV